VKNVFARGGQLDAGIVVEWFHADRANFRVCDVDVLRIVAVDPLQVRIAQQLCELVACQPFVENVENFTKEGSYYLSTSLELVNPHYLDLDNYHHGDKHR
jgi:hypothetical protein